MGKELNIKIDPVICTPGENQAALLIGNSVKLVIAIGGHLLSPIVKEFPFTKMILLKKKEAIMHSNPTTNYWNQMSKRHFGW